MRIAEYDAADNTSNGVTPDSNTQQHESCILTPAFERYNIVLLRGVDGNIQERGNGHRPQCVFVSASLPLFLYVDAEVVWSCGTPQEHTKTQTLVHPFMLKNESV
jgi:hypothetical protein